MRIFREANPLNKKAACWLKMGKKQGKIIIFCPISHKNFKSLFGVCLEQNVQNSNFTKFIKNENLDYKLNQIFLKSYLPNSKLTKFNLNDPNTGISKFFTVFGHTKVPPLSALLLEEKQDEKS